jgi:tetratricopeptide (TPR) repeat protein
MTDITNVNLLYLRKARGIAPLSRYAVQDDGSVVASVPDEMEVRTFHVVRFDTRGRSQIIETYNVETLRRTEIGASGQSYLGTTDDDLYLFRDSRKSRFLPDRRASYTDVALNASGQRFATAFCDMLASGHALALGDSNGRLLWTKDIAFPVARIAVDREGQFIAVGGENGDLVVLDAARNTRMRHLTEVPICAVATIGLERTVFAGGGGVGLVDTDGKLLWFAELLGDPLEIAMDQSGQTVAVLLRLDETSGRLVFLSADGLPTWDIDFDESRPTGISFSANGRFAAVSLRDGTLSVYELHFGERVAAADAEQILSEARTAQDAGNLTAAVELLRSRLAAVPSDTRACKALSEVLSDLRERSIVAAGNAEAVGDFREADSRFAEISAMLPVDAEITALRRELRVRWDIAARKAGQEAVAAGNGPLAEQHYLEAIEADPLDASARVLLADARHTAAEGALARGRSLIAVGRFTEAIDALTEAQQRGASGPEVTGLLRTARVGEAMELGNQLYQDRQYAAALFQFKKVLRLDPDNNDALQKVSYAQNFLQDTQLNERFTRLE